MKQLSEVAKKIGRKVADNAVHMMAFLTVLLLFMIAFACKEIYPFGKYTFLRLDAYHQYAVYFRDFIRRIREGGSFEYSWYNGLGGSYAPLYSYYLSGPLNWLLVLVPEQHVVDIVSFLMVIKVSVCAYTFSYYLTGRFHTKNIFNVIISICYALSAYMVHYSFNVMWLDSLMVFPLIVLGLEKLYKQRKCGLYFFSLTYAIIANYYISIIICIFLFLYYLFLMFVDSEKKSLRQKIATGRDFVIYSLLAGGAAAFVILPALMALGGTASGHNHFPDSLKLYNSFADLALRPFMLIEKEDVLDRLPNMYCSVIVMLLVPMYIFNKKINIREKIAYIIFVMLMVVSFNLNLLDYIWHGFHFTNGLFARNSFIYVFLVLVMSYSALLYRRELTDRMFMTSVFICVVYVVMLWKLKLGNTGGRVVYSEKTAYFTILFLVLYIGILGALKSEKRSLKMHINSRNLMSVLLLVIVSVELYINGSEVMTGTNLRKEYMADDDMVRYALAEMEKEEVGNFFRVEKEKMTIYNAGMWSGYHSTSAFCSALNEGVVDFFISMGMDGSVNCYGHDGATPLIDAILSVKYILSDEWWEQKEGYELWGCIEKTSDGRIKRIGKNEIRRETSASYGKTVSEEAQTDLTGSKEDTVTRMYIYKNNYALPLGFMVNDEFENTGGKKQNPFEQLNRLSVALTGTQNEMFEKIPVAKEGAVTTFQVEDSAHMYFEYNTPLWIVMASVKNDLTGKDERQRKVYDNSNYITDMGVLEQGDTVELRIMDTDMGDYECDVVRYHSDTMKEVYQKLKDNVLKVREYGDNYIKATISADEKGILMLSVPYEKGWEAVIDGKKAELRPYGQAFLSMDIEKGEHTVTLRYRSAPLRYGMVVSGISWMMYFILCGWRLSVNSGNKRKSKC